MQAIRKMLEQHPQLATCFDEQDLMQYFALNYAPEPDLFIRTGGEKRISNFLLWQLAYTELYFTDTLWPDFDARALDLAIQSYQQRERRFGRTSEQLQTASSVSMGEEKLPPKERHNFYAFLIRSAPVSAFPAYSCLRPGFSPPLLCYACFWRHCFTCRDFLDGIAACLDSDWLLGMEQARKIFPHSFHHLSITYGNAGGRTAVCIEPGGFG